MDQNEAFSQDEIIEMARQAGFHEHDFPFKKFKFEAFAKLVDAKATAKAVGREREACAKVCDGIDDECDGENVRATWCSQAIRAR